VSVRPKQTLQLPNVVASTFGRSGVARGVIDIQPLKGSLAVDARLRTTFAGGNIGATLPLFGRSAGLRLGDRQLFAGVEDSRRAALTAKTPGTSRASLILQETTGSAATVQVSVLFADGRSIVASSASKTFRLGAGEMVVIDDVAEEILGSSRETAFGDLHDVQIQIRVTEGSGAVLPLIVAGQNDSGDVAVRWQ
jgi:hypothetical protein